LIEHFSSIAAAAPELNLRKIFSGARKAIPTWLDPDEDRIVREGYAIANGTVSGTPRVTIGQQ